MKKFTFIVFVWFLFQLMFASAASNSNAVRFQGLGQEQLTKKCEEASPFLAASAGLLFPITQFTFITGDFCWNK